MRRLAALLCWVALLVFGALPSASAQDRIALVVGVGDYKRLRKLDNPAVDAKAFAAMLRRHGFTVLEVIDTPFAEMNDALVRFGGLAKRAKEAVVYLAGHGFERGATNIFAASDADIDCASEEMTRSLSLKEVYTKLSSVPKIVVVLDACRDNPFPFCPRKPRSGQARSGMGFGDLQGDAQAGSRDQDILVANSTARGEIAEDGEPGQHSPYAKALFGHLASNPNMTFRVAHSAAAKDVQRVTGLRQRPTYTVVGDEPEICLAGSPCGADANNAVRTKEDTDRKAREEAERGLREAENRAETQKRIELAALEQAKLRAAEDAAKSQAMKATATTAANEKALRDKLAAEIADLKAKEDAVAAHVKQVELVRSIQVELQNRRCKPGNPDGKWGPLVRQAAARFMSQAKVNIATNEPTEALLTALRAVPNQFCVQCADDEIQAGNACQQKPASKPVSASSGQQSQGGGSGSKASAGSGGGAKTNPGGSRPGRGGGCDRYMFSGQSCTDGAGRTCVQSGTQRSCQ